VPPLCLPKEEKTRMKMKMKMNDGRV
jgi:hypothetical protein